MVSAWRNSLLCRKQPRRAARELLSDNLACRAMSVFVVLSLLYILGDVISGVICLFDCVGDR